MGSPIESWEGAAAVFTGAGGSSPMIILIISILLCVGLIVQGAIHEEHKYNKSK
ncbi:MAG: hypothetical protein AAF492_01290 [Verrucomicrobiota bacterium]